MTELRWYGWGDASKTYSLDHRPDAWKFLRAALDLHGDEQFPVCDFECINLRAPRIDKATLLRVLETDFRPRSTPGVLVETDKRARVLHAYGRSYRDLIRLRRGEIPNPPDAVVFPATEEQVVRLIQFCAEQNVGRMSRDNAIGQWEAIKRAATECIMLNGGTLSHHHSIGYEHALWMKNEIGALGMEALRAVKQAFDPQGIMNPGKLVIGL